ncbi:hypothetical protein ACHAWF_011000 [Thalassiosira exigua]
MGRVSSMARRPAATEDGRGALGVGGPASSLASDSIFRALVFLVAVSVALEILVVWEFQSGFLGVDSAGRVYSEPAAFGGIENGGPGDGAATDHRDDRKVDSDVDAPPIDVPALLEQAGIDVDAATRSKLPTPSQIASMYGPRPVVSGLDSCAAFRSAVRPEDRHVAPAGLFNTGTNNLAILLRRNCYLPQRAGAREDRWKSGMRFQVPWGKHNPVSWRFKNVAAQGGKGIVQGDVLPVVVVRDPISWMASMCKHPYGVRLAENCADQALASSVHPVAVPYKPHNVTRYDSLVDLWHRWYTDWLTAARDERIPALFVRFEDLLFHPDEVVQRVCDCAGGTRRDALYLKDESAKGEGGTHAGGSGLLDAMIKNGNVARRRGTLRSDEDRRHATGEKFSGLLAKFRYSVEGIR